MTGAFINLVLICAIFEALAILGERIFLAIIMVG